MRLHASYHCWEQQLFVHGPLLLLLLRSYACNWPKLAKVCSEERAVYRKVCVLQVLRRLAARPS
jgi:hypothetical protein